jgi:hypothetical protein
VEDDLILIEWDSITLSQMPGSVIEQCEAQGTSWQLIRLYSQEVQITTSRDAPRDIVKSQRELEAQSTWLFLGEQGKRIQHALAGIDEDDERVAFSAWRQYLEQHLIFPFDAVVVEHWMPTPVSVGDQGKIQVLGGIEDPYGVLVRVTFEGRSHPFPLCDLEVIDKNSPNYQLVDDYATWFANR